MSRAVRWGSWIVGGAGALVLGLLYGAGTFPPGDDPGNLLHFARVVAEGRWGELRYPPLLPVLLAPLWVASGGEMAPLLPVVKLLPPAILVATGVAAARLARVEVAHPAGPPLAFALVTTNALLWFDLAWGGYPQLLALAFALEAAARYRRWIDGDQGAPWGAALSLALAALTNPYPAFFVPVAVGSMALVDEEWRPGGDRWREALAPAAVVAVAGLGTYVPLAPHLKGTEPIAALGWTGTLAGLPGQALPLLDHLVGPLAAAVLGLGASWVGQRRDVTRRWSAALLGVAIVAVVLQVGTFMNLTGRSIYVLATLASVGGAVGLASSDLPWTLPGSRPGSDLRAPLLAGLLVALLALPTSAVMGREDARAYRLPDDAVLPAAEILADARPGDVVVSSPAPVGDGWWLRAATGRDVLVGGTPSSHLFADDLHRMTRAVDLLQGRAGIRGDGGSLLTEGCAGGTVTLAIYGGFTLVHVVTAPPDAVRIATGPGDGTPIVGTAWEGPDTSDRGVVERARVDGMNVTRTLRPDPTGGLLLEVSAPAPAERVEITLLAPPGGSWADRRAGPGSLRAQALAAGWSHGPTFDLRTAATNGTADVTVDPAGHWLKAEANRTDPGHLELLVSLWVDRLHPPYRPVDTIEEVAAAGATHLYVRDADEQLATRLHRDPGITPVGATPGGDTTIYRLDGEGVGERCRS